VGHTDEVLDQVVRAVAPASWPLPRQFAGPVGRDSIT
jgi:hypothetical protein